MAGATFEERLELYADLIVKVGLNLQDKQRLVVVSGLETAPLVRAITKQAYLAGSRLVTILWYDDQIHKLRLQHAPRDSFEEYPAWKMQGVEQCIKQGDAYLQIFARDPELLKGLDPEAVAAANRTAAKFYKPVADLQGKSAVQWNLACPSAREWALKVFPDEEPETAEALLWEQIFKICRIDQDDPVSVWEQHLGELAKRKVYLTTKQYAALEYHAPGTELRVGLPKGHIWEGGKIKTPGGVPFVPNLPTEEIFTLPHKDQVEGVVVSTKPLSYRGSVMENFSLRFEGGKVVQAGAEVGEETLHKLLEADENAGRLGEVALVPHGSPISQSGLVFMNSLYDENASSHFALGQAYQYTLEGGEELTSEEFAQAGGNNSIIHVDFMIGSGQMDIDGVKDDGTKEAVMRAGGWAFEV